MEDIEKLMDGPGPSLVASHANPGILEPLRNLSFFHLWGEFLKIVYSKFKAIQSKMLPTIKKNVSVFSLHSVDKPKISRQRKSESLLGSNPD